MFKLSLFQPLVNANHVVGLLVVFANCFPRDNIGDNGEIETNYYEMVESFDDLNLKDEVLRGIYQYGFERPSAIQQRAILPCLQGRDIIAQAQSGTGKTATFTISILQKLDPAVAMCQALVLAPTRELAKQIQSVS